MTNNDGKNDVKSALDQTRDMSDAKPDSFTGLKEEALRMLDTKGDEDMFKRIAKHSELCAHLNEVYREKNKAYGDSFGEAFRMFGPISAMTRIFDKWHRLKTLLHDNVVNEVNDESVRDTLLDMANYCMMTVMEIDAGHAQTEIANKTETKRLPNLSGSQVNESDPSDDDFGPKLRQRHTSGM